MKFSSDLLKQLNRLPAEQRARVDAMVRRHVQACLRQGFQPENLERVYIEAMEIAEMPEEAPAVDNFRHDGWRHYPQYVSPRAL